MAKKKFGYRIRTKSGRKHGMYRTKKEAKSVTKKARRLFPNRYPSLRIVKATKEEYSDSILRDGDIDLLGNKTIGGFTKLFKLK